MTTLPLATVGIRLAVTGSVFVAGIASTTHAQPARSDREDGFGLSLTTPSDTECTSLQHLIGATEQRVDRATMRHRSDRAALHIKVVIRHLVGSRTGFDARVRVRDGGGVLLGERRLNVPGNDCHALDEALVVVLSTLVGTAKSVAPAPRLDRPRKLANTNAGQPAEAGGTGGPNDEMGQVVDGGRGLDSTDERDSDGLSGLVLAGVISGELPGLAPGGTLAGALTLGRFQWLANLSAWPSQSVSLGSDASARFHAGGISFLTCLVVLPIGRAGGLSLCAGPYADALLLSTSGLDRTRTRVAPAIGGAAGLQAAFPLDTGAGLVVRLEARLPVARPRFYIVEADGQQNAYHIVGPGLVGEAGVYIR